MEQIQKRPHLWPSMMEFLVYDDYLYNCLTNDERRNSSYQAAIQQFVKNKVVVDIGVGPDPILARLCREAGAKKIYAIEINPETARQAQKNLQECQADDIIEIIQGDAREIVLLEFADVCISELIGTIGGAEGAVPILNQVRRLLKPECIMIPQRSLTKFAALTFPAELWQNLGFKAIAAEYVKKVFRTVGYPFDLRLCIHPLPQDHLLSDAGVFEDLNFNQPLAETFCHDNCLHIQHPGRFDGFIVWLTLETLPGTVIDVLQHTCSWMPVFIPIFTPGVEVMPGDQIEVRIRRSLSENGLNPDYQLTGAINKKNGAVQLFNYHSYHNQPIFRGHPFYQRLFCTATTDLLNDPH